MGNYILKQLHGEMTEGKTIIFPKMKVYSLYDYDIVIQHMCTLSRILNEGIIRATFSALVEEMLTSMHLGHNIKIDGLGIFSLSLEFDTSKPSEEALAYDPDFDDEDPKLKYRHVRIKSINFKPDPELLKEMNMSASFKLIDVDVKTPKESRFSREERLAKARAIINRYGYMTLADYAMATEQSKSAASKDLNRLVKDPDSGIIARGDNSHKIWVDSKARL
jgi:hypothetical protein